VKITEIEGHIVLAPDMDPRLTSSAQDSLVVLIHTDEGATGIGDTGVNPWMPKVAILTPGTHTMGLCIRDRLIWADPLDIAGFWDGMCKGTAMNGRRGVVIHAMGAIDIALWDLKGKALGLPVHPPPGGAVKAGAVPHASLLPKGNSFAACRDALVRAAVRSRALGFRAVKAEVLMNGPYTHEGMHESCGRHTDVVAAVRKAVGPDVVLMVDVGYLWPDAASCPEIVRDWAEFGIYFLETPVRSDDVEESRKVRDGAPMKVAAGEWLAPRYEFHGLMDVGGVQVAQPDVGCVGGISEAKTVCDTAVARGATIVPHCWKTAISLSATAHLAFATPHCAFVAYLPPQLYHETLRRELAYEELALVDGRIPVPQKPGRGIELNHAALKACTVG
jgi:L-alanine-DL-glutamate epimerase-like enolase superfamily enzyme